MKNILHLLNIDIFIYHLFELPKIIIIIILLVHLKIILERCMIL